MSRRDTGADEQRVLAEQIAYYRARAPEYDDWFYRRGAFDNGAEWNGRWRAELDELAGALDRARPGGNVLELACGTGLWTERLAPYAAALTCVDASPEVLALNRQRMRGSRIRYVCADLFHWRPTARYDFIFFGFWLSHVPAGSFIRFWSLVGDCLAPGGRVFFADNRLPPDGWRDALRRDGSARSRRRLTDGREFEIVKIYHRPDDLEAHVKSLGWRAVVRGTPTFFLHGTAVRRRQPHHRPGRLR
ncbi:MAG: class I SAM-dependent methyltransferase [Acidobacteria bacterium]|nr:class I SAM-dependent methyltransferase [Acidobacteriota bacterium]